MSRQDCGGDLNTAEGAALYRQVSESDSDPKSSPLPSTVSLNSVIDGPLHVGETFGRYRIERILGSGGMAHVYQAWDEELNEAVALKLIRRDLSSNPDLTLRFKRELSLARQVTHKNVVRIYDLGEVNSIKYISMQLVEGENLALMMERGRPPLEFALSIAHQLCAGLAAAHQVQVVHRDLKPENIMVDRAGQAYLMDFGIARSVETTKYTTTGAAIGTVDYMSPEQANGAATDYRSDIYTLGLILYELFTGERPFKGPTPLSRLTERISKPAPDPLTICPGLPQYIATIIRRCLERNPDLRYASVAEIEADFNKQQPTPARWRLRLRKVRAGRIVAVLAICLVALVGVYEITTSIRRVTTTEVASAREVSLAILPFTNTGDKALDWLGPTLADRLRTDIGQSKQLRNVSADRLYRILGDLHLSAGVNMDSAMLRQVGDLSNANLVIWGTYSKIGGEVRLEVALQDPTQERVTPFKLVAKDDNELLPGVTNLARSIQREILAASSVKDQIKVLPVSSNSLPALRYYSEGLQNVQNLNNGEALKDFQAAVRTDPNFATAYSRLAQVHRTLRQDREAEETSRRAVDLSKQLPQEERLLITGNHWRILNDNAKAIGVYETLAGKIPEDSDIHFTLGSLYQAIGDSEKARAQYDRVLKLDPKHPDALFAVAQVEIRRGNPQAAIEPLSIALGIAIKSDNAEAHGRILNAIGITYKRLNKPAEALHYYEEALVIRRRLGQKTAIAATLSEKAQVEDSLGNLKDARSDYEEGLRVRREIADKKGIADILVNFSVFDSDRGNYDEALKALGEALGLYRELNDKSAEATCLNNIGVIYLLKASYDEALTYFQQSLNLRQALKVPAADLGQTYNNLGEAEFKLARYEEALGDYLKAIDQHRRAGDKRAAALDSLALGAVYDLQGRYGAALSKIEEALDVFTQLQDHTLRMAEILSAHGRVLAHIGRWADAEHGLAEALNLARDFKNEALVVQTLNSQGEIRLYRGDYNGARKQFQQAFELASQIKDLELTQNSKLYLAEAAIARNPATAIRTLATVAQEAESRGLKYLAAAAQVDVAEAYIQANDYSGSRSQFESALTQAEKLGSRLLIARAHYFLGRLLQRQRDLQAALDHMSEARRILKQIADESPGVLERADFAEILADTK